MRKLRTLLVDLSRGRRRKRRRAAARREHGSRLIDALARHGDGLPAQRAAARGQRGDAGRPGGDRGGVRLWRQRACAFCCARSRATTSTGLRKTIALAEPILAGLGFGARPRRHDRDRRSGRARRSVARHRAARRPRRARRASRRSAASATCCGSRCANCTRRAGAGRRGRAARRRAVRHDRGQCRRLHALPLLRVGLPDRRAVGRSRAADAALRRGCLRAMRAVQGDLPGEGHHADAAARLPRRDRVGARASRRKSRSTASAAASRSA